MSSNYTNNTSEQSNIAGEPAAAYVTERRVAKPLGMSHRARQTSDCKADPTLMSKDEFYAKLDRAEEDIRRGRCFTFTNMEDMHAWLNSL